MTEFLVFVGVMALIGLIVLGAVWLVSEVFALRRDVDRHYKYLERYWELINKKADKPNPTKS